MVAQFVDRLLPTESESMVAATLLAAGDEASLRAALEIDPGNEDAIVALAELLVARGDTDEALALLDADPRDRAHPEGGRRGAAGRRRPTDDHDATLTALLDQVKDDDEARQQFVDILELMGPDDPRTAGYRRQLTARLVLTPSVAAGSRDGSAGSLGCSDLPRSRCRRRRRRTAEEVAVSELPPRPSPPPVLRESARAWIDWFGITRLIATAVAVVVVVGGGWLLVRTPSPAAEATLARHVGFGAAVDARRADHAPTGTSTFVVHVAGAVAAPGVYDVRGPARVVDAIEAAGGPTPEAELDALNLAAPLVDGQRIYVPVVGEIVAARRRRDGRRRRRVERTDRPQHAPRPPSSRSCPASGRRRPAAIVEHRDEHGPFASVDDLTDVQWHRSGQARRDPRPGAGLTARSASAIGQYSDSPRITVAAINEPAAPSATPANIHAYSRQNSRHVAIGDRVARREATRPINSHSGDARHDGQRVVALVGQRRAGDEQARRRHHPAEEPDQTAQAGVGEPQREPCHRTDHRRRHERDQPTEAADPRAIPARAGEERRVKWRS